MIWFEVYAIDFDMDEFKRIIQAKDLFDALTQFNTMHPHDKPVDIKRI